MCCTHQVECAPADGGPRWAVGALLRPDLRAAQAVEQVARAAAAVVGANHWLAGAARSSHLSARRRLEPRRRPIRAGDRLVARYGAALRAAAKSAGPVRFAVTGLILTPVSVMGRANSADAAADDLAAAARRGWLAVTAVLSTFGYLVGYGIVGPSADFAAGIVMTRLTLAFSSGGRCAAFRSPAPAAASRRRLRDTRSARSPASGTQPPTGPRPAAVAARL